MGLGVKTTRDFLKGEVVAEYSGDLVEEYAEYKLREKKYIAAGLSGGYQFQFWNKGKRNWSVKNQLCSSIQSFFHLVFIQDLFEFGISFFICLILT